MSNRDNVYAWFTTMTTLHISDDIETAERASVMYYVTKTPSETHIKHRAVFSKLDVVALLGPFFKRESDVPLKLCIYMDNLFMAVSYWLVHYVAKSDSIYSRLNNTNSEVFFEKLNKTVIHWFEAELLVMRYSTNFINKFKKATIIYACYVSMAEKRCRFDIEIPTFRLLLRLCHKVLEYAITPAMVHRGYPLVSQQWANLFIYAIRDFETNDILCNDKLTRLEDKEIPWLVDGVEDFE
ncbi:unnamed protein product [Macrosiphum euphorbiae]|uniref:Uncharacterized protein n=1 Tax=Macrosiphum euphorbiae TaxID=13131 RepID=A0AAV0Y560_9HEMI|nr:unnamed protein product [Macrosiphum euphorbiae]